MSSNTQSHESGLHLGLIAVALSILLSQASTAQTTAIAIDSGVDPGTDQFSKSDFVQVLGTDVRAMARLRSPLQITGVHLLDDGEAYFSVGSIAEVGGVTVFPNEIWRMTSAGPIPVVSRSELGLPANVRVDALAFLDEKFFLSVDSGFDLNGQYVSRSTVLEFGGQLSVSPIQLDACGSLARLNLDSLHIQDASSVLGGFASSGELDGTVFKDTDVVACNTTTGSVSLTFSASTLGDPWLPAGISAYSLNAQFLFSDGFDPGDTE